MCTPRYGVQRTGTLTAWQKGRLVRRSNNEHDKCMFLFCRANARIKGVFVHRHRYQTHDDAHPFEEHHVKDTSPLLRHVNWGSRRICKHQRNM